MFSRFLSDKTAIGRLETKYWSRECCKLPFVAQPQVTDILVDSEAPSTLATIVALPKTATSRPKLRSSFPATSRRIRRL